MKKILVAGGVSWDSLLYMGELPQPRSQTVFTSRAHETVGSTGAGKAMNLGRLGTSVVLHAFVGDDRWGHDIRTRFDREPFGFIGQLDPAGTERHVNLMAEDGSRISMYASYATFEPKLDLPRMSSLVRDCDVLALNIINYCRQLIPAAREHGVPIWCDIHDWDGKNDYHREFVNAADYLFLSSGALGDWRGFLEEQVAAGKRLVVATHGAEGATALDAEGNWHDVPVAQAREVVDTNGAGDAFFAGTLYGHLLGHGWQRALELGAVVAALAVESPELANSDLSPTLVEAEWRRHFGDPE